MSTPIHALLASYDYLDSAVDAIEGLRKAGFRSVKAYAPYPEHHIEAALGYGQSPVRVFALVGGLTGAAAGFAFTIWTSMDWPLVVGALVRSRLKVACIGTAADEAVPPAIDARAAPLPVLMDLLANARLCVGVSSGTMHLAAACGCPLLVWGNNKQHYKETLRTRYETTWNPHHVPVAWLDAADWQPHPSRVLTTIADLL